MIFRFEKFLGFDFWLFEVFAVQAKQAVFPLIPGLVLALKFLMRGLKSLNFTSWLATDLGLTA